MEVTWLRWASHQLGSGGRGCVTRDSAALCSVTMCWPRCFLLQSPIMFPPADTWSWSPWPLVTTEQVTSHTPANSFLPRSLVIAV